MLRLAAEVECSMLTIYTSMGERRKGVNAMNSRERIRATLRGEAADRMPLLGGFLVAQRHYCELAGASDSEFDVDPEGVGIRAYRQLGIDGLLLLRLPPGEEEHFTYRAMSKQDFLSYQARFRSPEDVRDWVLELPSPRDHLRAFPIGDWKDRFIADFEEMQDRLGDIVWMPSQWDVVHPTFEWFNHFGYENYMLFLISYPEVADKLFGAEVETQRAISAALVDTYRRLDAIPLLHVGTDICGRDGPVISPAFLRQYYFPHVRRCLEPLAEAGFATVWHADGQFMPIADDILACGVSGFQGFQWEYGIDLAALVEKRTFDGKPLTLFAGPSTSATLPFGSKQMIGDEIRRTKEIARGKCNLFFLPASDILPDTPADHIITAYTCAAAAD